MTPGTEAKFKELMLSGLAIANKHHARKHVEMPTSARNIRRHFRRICQERGWIDGGTG